MLSLALRSARYLLLVLLAVGALMIVGAPSAYASDGEAVVSFEPNLPMVLTLLVSIVFPLFVGVVTKKTASGRLKAILLATISLLSGLASQLLAAVTAGATFDLFTALVTGVGAWLIAIGTYEGFWKPTGIGEAAQSVGVGAGKRVDGGHNA
ncbi:MAG: hypothetical protein K0S37_1983 [Microbacterium sp.]|jgi:hypothetical protein|nr:hypothetical protein [Microbacterium sp.]